MAANTGKPPGIDPNTSPSTNQSAGGIASLINQIDQQDQIGLANEGVIIGGVNGVLGGLPVAEKNQEYFAIIQEAGDTTPEIIDQTQFKVTYLCDSQLNVSKPAEGSVTVQNINQNFERQKNAVVRVDQGTVLNNQLLGSHPITAIGSIEPILGTQIGNGPTSYVTTMSFQQEGQLGQAPGVNVTDYYLWIKKTQGLSNPKLSTDKAGYVVFREYGGSWLNPPNVVENPTEHAYDLANALNDSNLDNPYRLYFDTQQGGGSVVGVDGFITGSNNEINPTTIPSNVDQDNGYINIIQCVTSSIEGRSRVRFKAQVGLSISTSSMYDIWQSFNAVNNDLGLADWGGQIYSRFPIVKLAVWRKRGSERTKLVEQGQPFDVFNATAFTFMFNLLNAGSAGEFLFSAFLDGSLDPTYIPGLPIPNVYANFWQPDYARYWTVQTDYVDVELNDEIYTTITLPYEPTASLKPNGSVSQQVTQSVIAWRNKAARRTWNVIDSNLYVSQETPPGDTFIQGETGVTASYLDSDGSASIYNYTGSYFIDFNNYSSSEDGIGAYLTSSTALANFYGGEYTQVNPGTEVYNVVNADLSPSSSLGIGADKKTWDKFGFNPIRLPFTILPGDFIRFEYAKDKTHMIKSVSSIENVLIIELQNQLDFSFVLDNFVIYRILDSGQYIILDVKKNNEAGVDQTFTGIILPEYRSKELEENEDQLIFRLKQAGIIET